MLPDLWNEIDKSKYATCHLFARLSVIGVHLCILLKDLAHSAPANVFHR